MAEALPSPSLTIREAPRKNPSGSLSFRERLPQSADSRRLDEVGEAAQAAALAVRVVDRSGNSLWARIKKGPREVPDISSARASHFWWRFDSFGCRASKGLLTKIHELLKKVSMETPAEA
jgi:hypothetical protein